MSKGRQAGEIGRKTRRMQSHRRQQERVFQGRKEGVVNCENTSKCSYKMETEKCKAT